jgi:DNA-binding transcriptional LysR family regulator
MHDWDNLRFFLAVAQAGSVTAAAEKLKVNQSTVSRRINGFEQKLKVRLFERFSSGYELTPEGEELLHRAQRIEEEAHAIERHVMGKNVELSGPIRVTCSLAIARYLLIPLLKRFHKMHPAITVHLDLSNGLYNLTAREADVAIRVTRDAIPETLIGREVGQVEYGVYGERNYVECYRKKNDDQPLHWIGEDNSQERPNWLPPGINPLKLIMRSNDVLATLDLLKQGLGVGRLPHFIAREEKKLKQLEFKHAIQAIPVWMLTHADMRRVNRISVFTAFVVDELRSQLGYH